MSIFSRFSPHNKLRAHDTHRRDPYSTLGGSVSSADVFYAQGEAVGTVTIRHAKCRELVENGTWNESPEGIETEQAKQQLTSKNEGGGGSHEPEESARVGACREVSVSSEFSHF
jgi:hypothetical protein